MFLTYENNQIVMIDYYNKNFVGRGGTVEQSQQGVQQQGAVHSLYLNAFALRMVRTEQAKKLRKAYEGGRYTTDLMNTVCQSAERTGFATPSQRFSKIILSCAVRAWPRTGKNDGKRLQRLEIGGEISNSLTTVQKDMMVMEIKKTVCEHRYDEGLRFFKGNVCGTIRTIHDGGAKE